MAYNLKKFKGDYLGLLNNINPSHEAVVECWCRGFGYEDYLLWCQRSNLTKPLPELLYTALKGVCEAQMVLAIGTCHDSGGCVFDSPEDSL